MKNPRRESLPVAGRIGFFLAIFLCVSSMSAVTASGATPLFFDDFNGTMLDPTRWNVLDGGGSIQVGGGQLLSSGFPEHKRIDSSATFPVAGAGIRARARNHGRGAGKAPGEGDLPGARFGFLPRQAGERPVGPDDPLEAGVGEEQLGGSLGEGCGRGDVVTERETAGIDQEVFG